MAGKTLQIIPTKMEWGKAARGFLVMSLLLSTSGCMTNATIQTAKGNPQNIGLGWREDSDHKPHPAYYALIPITVPFDIATAPIQGIFWLAANPTPTKPKEKQPNQN